MHYALTLKSRNEKTGKIPVTTSSATTCPDACPLKSGGCYAKGGPLGMYWQKVTSGQHAMNHDALVAQIAALPAGQAWRHNQAGDLAGHGDHIDVVALGALVTANSGKRGWTYTHKPMNDASNLAAVRDANARGFTVNLSANTLGEADTLKSLNAGPVVVVLDAPEGAKADTVTPEGHKVITCPATYRDDVTCASCMLCQKQRDVIVGFPAHGASKKKAASIARGLRQ